MKSTPKEDEAANTPIILGQLSHHDFNQGMYITENGEYYGT